MKKLLLLLLISITISCSSSDVEPIILTEESFAVELSDVGFFGTNNITAQANASRTFLRVQAVYREQSFVLEIGNSSPNAPVLSVGTYSVNAHGELVARMFYQDGEEMSRTESGLFRSVEITQIDLDSGIVSGIFSGFLSDENNQILEATNGQFIGVFFSIEE
jgi:hypothetical protein